MSSRKFESGDRVRHVRRPEWGTGSVVKAEEVTANGRLTQRVSVRFPNAGVKTLSAAHAELQLVEEPVGSLQPGEAHPMAMWEKMDESGWLAPLARKQVDETMIALDAEVRDPFSSLRRRLTLTLDLYRFQRAGGALIDWAVAQSGLSDPLTRFTRHELEHLFDRWAAQRDSHLDRLLKEARGDATLTQELVASAPEPAQEAVRRLTAAR